MSDYTLIYRNGRIESNQYYTGSPSSILENKPRTSTTDKTESAVPVKEEDDPSVWGAIVSISLCVLGIAAAIPTRGLTLAGCIPIMAGCGSTVSNPADAEDDGETCAPIDDFEDGNLVAESFEGNWAAMEGSTLINEGGILRVEGHPVPPWLNVGAELRFSPGRPIDVQDYDTIFADMRCGYLSDPTRPFTGKLVFELEGYTASGGTVTAVEFEGYPFNELTNYHFVYDDSEDNPDFALRHLTHVRIYLDGLENDSYFIEVDNLEFCRTGWPPFT